MKVKHYGDMIAQLQNKKLIDYIEFGSYSGDYIVVLDDGDNVELWKGHYGSCSGCDWLESEDEDSDGKWMRDDYSYSISEEKAIEYLKGEKSFATIPKETVLRVSPEVLAQMLPANVRDEMYNFEPVEFSDKIKSALHSSQTIGIIKSN